MWRKKLLLKKTHDFCASRHPRLTVVLLHGVAADSATYHKALTYLEGTASLKDVRFITFDLLGSGKSPKSDNFNYDYKDQVTALNKAITKLKLSTPLVLVGHSLGALIAAKYADTHKKSVRKLILVSPPVYTLEDMANPTFAAGIEVFIKTVSLKNRNIQNDRVFINSLDKIALNKKNYQTLAELKTRTVLIYGDADKIIAPHNIPKLLKDNPRYLTAIKTIGRHGMSRGKYNKIREILEEVLYA